MGPKIQMKKQRKISKKINYTTITLIAFTLFFLIVSGSFFPKTYEIDNLTGNVSAQIENGIILAEVEKENLKDLINYVETPDQVKAIYMSACVAATKNFRQDLVNLIKETELNSVVIDIKDSTGTISFETGLEGDNGEGCRSRDMKEFIAELHEEGIYVIGRLTVFQDFFYAHRHPEYAVKRLSDKSVWLDRKGVSFIDVGAKSFWEYILEIAKISHQIGFDEINFDYIRFPSDGNMRDIYFPHSNSLIESNPEEGKAIALENFFKWIHNEITEYNKDLKNPMITSADLFGMVTTTKSDLNIGQVLERTLPYFDFIAPMVYPSHYPPNFNGWADPNKVPYELIYHVMRTGADRIEEFKNDEDIPQEIRSRAHIQQLRPWLQDFNYGGVYGPKEVRAQINATYDAGLNSWMLWAPSNRYTRAALKVE